MRWSHKLFLLLVSALVCGLVLSSNVFAADGENKVELTKQQQEEIAEIQQEILEKKKEVIAKYVEFGVFSEEKGNHIIKKMEEHYSKLEKNGFIPRWEKRKHHHDKE
ncbi:YckD family protein [Alkalihalobacillus oceani]|uniref:YckD family protein n=1 Tax=Halalkalibacter oceani TaxID=1653776 RepID=UPI002041A3C2|nr:YckD family protein [Halalkalibacter oceani]MCM3759256.1 YckD family protein [Halalkalibacter oceani]